MPYKNFDEFNKKIRPFYGRGTVSKNMELIKYIEEKERKRKNNANKI